MLKATRRIAHATRATPQPILRHTTLRQRLSRASVVRLFLACSSSSTRTMLYKALCFLALAMVNGSQVSDHEMSLDKRLEVLEKEIKDLGSVQEQRGRARCPPPECSLASYALEPVCRC